MDLGPHATFIWLCYGATATVIAGLIAMLWLEGRKHRREIELLERQAAGRERRAVDGSPSS